MESTFETRPALTIIGMKHHGKIEGDAIPQLWGRFMSRMGEINAVNPAICYGVSDNYDETTGVMDYFAAVEVADATQAPKDMERITLPAQRYAVFTCTLPTMHSTYEQIYGTWLPSSGYRRGPGPEFELYDESFNPEDPKSQFRAYVPVVRLS